MHDTLSPYRQAVERELAGIEHESAGACPGCPECLHTDTPEEPGDEWHDLANEGSFSWSSCDACGSTFGGDRYPAHGYIANRQTDDPMDGLCHFNICVDCLMYLANGDEPEEWHQTPRAWADDR